MGYEDERAIRAVIFTYAWAIDTKDWDALRGCFTAACDLTYGGGDPSLPHPHGGEGNIAYATADAFVEYIARTHAPISSFHMMGASLVEPESPDRARARTYGRLLLAPREPAGGGRFESAGVYADVLVREDGAWRITERHYTRMWSDGNPDILGG
jgi:hypothetical protein